MSRFPEKLFCNITETAVEGQDRNVWAYEDVRAAVEGEHPVRVGIYQLVEVVEAQLVESVETTKVEN